MGVWFARFWDRGTARMRMSGSGYCHTCFCTHYTEFLKAVSRGVYSLDVPEKPTPVLSPVPEAPAPAPATTPCSRPGCGGVLVQNPQDRVEWRCAKCELIVRTGPAIPSAARPVSRRRSVQAESFREVRALMRAMSVSGLSTLPVAMLTCSNSDFSANCCEAVN